ncbi:MAG: glycosyltransferase [Myxococcota bacterium]
MEQPTPPKRLALISDHLRIPYANGSSFASQWLVRALGARGTEVTVVGPDDPLATAEDYPPHYVAMPSVPFRSVPGVHLALPSKTALRELARRRPEAVVAQAATALLDVGVWLREQHGVPMLSVNTLHLPSAYNAALPPLLERYTAVKLAMEKTIISFAEAQSVDAYNRGDGLVVLSSGLAQYWRDRGLEVPAHVIPRAIDPSHFDRPVTRDPFEALGHAPRGGRLLCVCRHVREKNLHRLLEVVATKVFPKSPDATLTLVGDGAERDELAAMAERLGVAERVFFPGEQSRDTLVDWYGSADLFLYMSLSETYGQVVTEALWNRLPAIALDDGMGVRDQIAPGHDGELVHPGGTKAEKDAADAIFAGHVVRLLANQELRRSYAEEAGTRARLRADPSRVADRWVEVLGEAKRYRDEAPEARRSEVPLLARWAGVHSLAFGLGLLRPPQHLKSHARVPGWDVAPDLRTLRPEPLRASAPASTAS